MKSSKNKKLKGQDGFEQYYSTLFGPRWISLKTALLQPINHFTLHENLKAPYFLDKASFYAATSLPFLEDGICLDMCAAPGGKTLVLISKQLGEKAQLQANELSLQRSNRLKAVLNEHLFKTDYERVTVSHFDGAKMAQGVREKYDRILLDAPCSSERHVLQSQKHLSEWSESRVKNLSIRQWALLSSAFLLLKPLGYLLYSTCALSELENDFVVEKLTKKYKNALIKPLEPVEQAEPTKHGLIFLPDTSHYGPLYFSLIQKIATASDEGFRKC
ncbi:MAG: SAM-dependent methyltransferase [Spirochaetaceae bacterium]|nr:SAM-dependent methyltransferase [Spirochaetaceae bacterium]